MFVLCDGEGNIIIIGFVGGFVGNVVDDFNFFIGQIGGKCSVDFGFSFWQKLVVEYECYFDIGLCESLGKFYVDVVVVKYYY